jgi:uncharacterized protein (DUF2384 family)
MSNSPQLKFQGFPVETSPSSLPAAQLRAYEGLVNRAIEVFGDAITADRWLSEPSPDLNNLVPLQIAEECDFDEKKIKERFEPIFARIEHGIYY